MPGDIYFGKPNCDKPVNVWVEKTVRFQMSGEIYVVYSWTSERYQCNGDSMDLEDFLKTFKKVEDGHF
jgi:hypothetical protein